MSHAKIVLALGAVIAVIIGLAVVGFSPRLPLGSLGASATPYSPIASTSEQGSGNSPVGTNGFVAQSGTQSLAGPVDQSPVYNGQAVTSLDQVAKIVTTPSPSPTPSSNIIPLTLPVVADSDITLDPSGAATAIDFLTYFNEHSIKDITFNNNRFPTALSDSNGVTLFTADLINKAIADGNFSEVHSSLLMQRDFANAEIAYLKKIKVTGNAVALVKQGIGAEELLISLINKAFAVQSSTVPLSSFVAYNAQFNVAMESLHQNLLVQTGALAVTKQQGFIARVLQALHLTAQAQSVNLPFGGRVGIPVPCLCDAGFWVIIGAPKPASIFVPIAFLASPFFYLDKSFVPGVWWLGLYNPVLQVPCLSAFLCGPVGSGGEIVMTGTSLL